MSFFLTSLAKGTTARAILSPWKPHALVATTTCAHVTLLLLALSIPLVISSDVATCLDEKSIVESVDATLSGESVAAAPRPRCVRNHFLTAPLDPDPFSRYSVS